MAGLMSVTVTGATGGAGVTSRVGETTDRHSLVGAAAVTDALTRGLAVDGADEGERPAAAGRCTQAVAASNQASPKHALPARRYPLIILEHFFLLGRSRHSAIPSGVAGLIGVVRV